MTRPSEKVREVFFAELERHGVHAERLRGARGAEIYLVEGDAPALFLLHVSTSEKGFWGLRKDFVDCLLGLGAPHLSDEVRAWLAWALSDRTSPEPKHPDNAIQEFFSAFSRLMLSAKGKQQWAVVLLLGRPDKWICDGWVLTRPDVIEGVRQWSLSKNDGDYKINKNKLDRDAMKRGLSAVVKATTEALSSS